MSSRTTTGSTSLSIVKAWDKCSVWIAALMIRRGRLSGKRSLSDDKRLEKKIPRYLFKAVDSRETIAMWSPVLTSADP